MIPFWLTALVFAVALLAIGMLVAYAKTFGPILSNKQDIWGQFGDYFGGVLNPLLSSLALAAVLVTLRIQAQDLKTAQDENRQTNRHLNDQAMYIRLQSFESVFFRLLDIHLDAKKEFTYSEGTIVHTGKFAFESTGKDFSDFEQETLANLQLPASEDEKNKITIDFEERFGNIFSTYFRSMYQILKYVDNYEGLKLSAEQTSSEDLHATDLGKNQRQYTREYLAKRQYINMLRAQMGQSERRALFASCLTAKGAGLKFYVERYSLLKGINFERMSLKEEIALNCYHKLAFSGQENIDFTVLKKHEEHQVR